MGTRLNQLKQRLEARVDPATGRARPGFVRNVMAIRGEITRLERGAAKTAATRLKTAQEHTHPAALDSHPGPA